MGSVTSTRMRTGGASRHDGRRSSLDRQTEDRTMKPGFAGGSEAPGEISH
jgi:hypothetical protein